MKKLLKLEDRRSGSSSNGYFRENRYHQHPPICLLLLHQLESADTGEKNAKTPNSALELLKTRNASDADAVMTQFSSAFPPSLMG